MVKRLAFGLLSLFVISVFIAVGVEALPDDLATVKAICDEIVVTLQGRIVEQGAKQEILAPHPHHEYTELLLSSVPEMDPGWLDPVLAKRRGPSAHTV